MLIPSVGKNVPIAMSTIDEPEAYKTKHFTTNVDQIISMAFLNQTQCLVADLYFDININNPTQRDDYCRLLNAAPAYYDVGLVRADNIGKFSIMSTRNNAFTNREQKTTITVTEDAITVAVVVSSAVAGLGVLAGLAFAGVFFMKKKV